jgi:MerR family transcriptional regulator, light-induced transcriptional regulator
VTDLSTPDPGQTYRIGAVARLTGIPPDTLRVWERRYAVVTPFRSDAGTRLYQAEDVSRLTLIKRLVDNGDAISHVASLSLDQLRDRVKGLLPQPLTSTSTRPCRVVVLGSTLPALLQLEQARAGKEEEAVRFVGLFTEETRFRDEAGRLEPDLVVFECPTIHADQLRDIGALLARAGAPRAMIVYNFASRAVIERLHAQRITPRRAPVDAADLRRWCLALHAAASEAPPPADMLSDLGLGGPIPPRRYNGADLTRIAASSPTVRCECPHHLVQLVSSLVAFENYSQECENRNADDAALHAFLHAATAQARATMESALARVIEAEGIEL